MPGSKPMATALRAQSKDWKEVEAHHKVNLATNPHMDREGLLNECAYLLTKRTQLGERLQRWSHFVAQAAGLENLSIGDDEAEAILVGWATVGWRLSRPPDPITEPLAEDWSSPEDDQWALTSTCDMYGHTLMRQSTGTALPPVSEWLCTRCGQTFNVAS